MGRLIKSIWFVLLVLLAIFLVLLLSLPLTAPPLISQLAKDQNIDLSIDKLSIDWFDTAVGLQGVSVSAINGNAKPFTLTEFKVRLSGTKLLREKSVHLDMLGIKGIDLPISVSLDANNQPVGLSVAEIDLSELIQPTQQQTESAEPVQDSESAGDSAWTFSGWSSIALDDINVQATLSKQDKLLAVPMAIRSASIGTLLFGSPSEPTNLVIDLLLNKVQIGLQGYASPLVENPDAEVSLNVEDVDFERWSQLLNFLGIETAPIVSMSGNLALASDIGWQQVKENHVIDLTDAHMSTSQLSILIDQAGEQTESMVETKESMQVAGELDLKINKVQIETMPMHYRVEQLVLESNVLGMKDVSLDPPLDVEVKALALELDALDSRQTANVTKINLNADVGSYGKVLVAANGNFLDVDVDGDIKAEVEQINLPRLSGLAKNAIGKHIDKGALDFQYNALVQKSQLDSKAVIEAHQLGLSGDYAAKSNIVEELGMPLNAALNLLRDKDDTVRLAVPVNGDLKDPQIRIGKIVNKALLNGLKTAVVTQFGPLLALSALDKAKDMATGLKLKPVVFENTSASIDAVAEEGVARLEAIAELLEKRPKIKMNVCGVSLASELSEKQAKKPASTEHDSLSESAILEQLEPSKKAALYDLANARAESVKNYLMQKSLEGNRIILCAPTILTGIDDLPAVKFSL